MAAADNAQKNIFSILEDFLIKVASLDVFEVLIFNYKLKSDLEELQCNFTPIIKDLISEVQELLNEHKNKAEEPCEHSNELYLFPSLDDQFEADNVPESGSQNKINKTHGGVEQPMDIITTTVLREMPLFSPKGINEVADSGISLWNTDSKSEVIPNQIHVHSISENATTSETCNSFQCHSCNRFFDSDFKLSAHLCKNNKENLEKHKTTAESDLSTKIISTKTNQEFPLDFRHSNEIRSLIEDALHISKEEYMSDNGKVDFKQSNDQSASIHAPWMKEYSGFIKENDETQVIGDVMPFTSRSKNEHQRKQINAPDFIEDVRTIVNSSNEEFVGNQAATKTYKSRKRALDIVCDKNSEKTEDALISNSSRKTPSVREEKISECALVNTVIIDSKKNENEVVEKQINCKAKVIKKKVKRKEKEEVAKKETIKKSNQGLQSKENQIDKDTYRENKEGEEFEFIRCSGSNITPFLCCGDCFHVFKDWELFDKHLCNTSVSKDNAKPSVNEDADDASKEPLLNEKENKTDLDKSEKELSVAANSITEPDVMNISSNHDIDGTENNSKIQSTSPKRVNKRASVIMTQETLRGIHRFVCSICLEEYRSLNRMMYHLPRCVTGPYKCELCPLEYSSRRELNLHKKKNHRDAQSFICDECGVKFKFRTSLQKHKVNRHERWAEKETYSCPHCALTFPKKIYLTNHCIKVHRLERKFLCQICGKKFLNQNSLNSHLNYHSDEAKSRFSCSQCLKSFLTKEKLQYHLRIHTGERPFACKACGKAFISKSKLSEHLWRHGEKKRYSCPLCPKKYAGRWDLKLHVRKMHGKNLNSDDSQLSEYLSESTNFILLESEKDLQPQAATKSKAETSNSNSKISPSEVIVVRDLQNGIQKQVNEADSLIVQLASVPNLGQAVLPSGTVLTLSNPVEHSLPNANSQHPQFIQLNSSSTASSVPIHIQVSSAAQGFDVSSQPGIIFTSGLYLS